MFLIVKTEHKWLGFIAVVVKMTAHVLVRPYLPHPLPGATLDSQDIADDLGVLILHKNLWFMEVQVFFFITEQFYKQLENHVQQVLTNRLWLYCYRLYISNRQISWLNPGSYNFPNFSVPNTFPVRIPTLGTLSTACWSCCFSWQVGS